MSISKEIWILCKCNETINEFDFNKIIIYDVITARFYNAINYMDRKEINMNALLLNEIETFGDKPESQKLTDKGFTPGGFEIAIRRATRDVAPRTLSRRSVAKGNLVDDLLYGEHSFLGEIEKYFSNDPCNEEKYDKWHTDMCRLVLGVIQRFYTQKNGTDVCYGKAQKIVNMTLKGCYCLNGARDKEEYFKHCHMALDSFTLTWYKRHGYKCESEWSNLSYDEYSEIKTNIRKIAPDIDVFEALTPLQIEFLIWPLEIMVATVKEINKCLGGLISADYAESYFEKHKLGFDFKMANIIIGKEVPDKLDADFINWLNQIPENQSNKKIAAEEILSRYE